MNRVEFIMYVIVLMILSYVFFKIYCNIKSNTVSIQENMVGEIKDSIISMISSFSVDEFNSIVSNKNFLNIGGIQSIDRKYSIMPLKQYCIKASLNSATTGKTVNKDMVKFVLSRGCRLLDFEVFYTKAGNNYLPVVAESTDPEFKLFSTDNHITLESVFTTIIGNCFSGNSPNKKDPLFIHLRIKTKDTECYSAISKLIDSILKIKLYQGEVNDKTKLEQLMGKIVIVIDKTIHRDYKDYAKCKGSDVKCYDLSNYLNVESGSQTINLYSLMQIENQASSPPLIKDDEISTTAISSKLVLPIQKSKQNPNMQKLVTNFGAQIIAYRYSNPDNNLVDCETFFNDNKSGIVPLAAAIPYFQRIHKESTKK